jgi:hypothetical protein
VAGNVVVMASNRLAGNNPVTFSAVVRIYIRYSS